MPDEAGEAGEEQLSDVAGDYRGLEVYMNDAQGKLERSDNAWRVTAWILAVLLALSLSQNAVVAWRVSAGAAGVSVTRSQGGGYALAATAPSGTTCARRPPGALAPVVDVSAGGGPVVGSRAAKVEVIAFLDYECAFCRQWYQESVRQLKNDYISTGKVRFVTRDYPLAIHARARVAAVAANCVRALTDDKTYYQYQGELFGSGDLASATLERDAVQLGIDKNAFERCSADAKQSMAKKVERDVADGAAAGVTGTPTFFVNGHMLVGAQPYATFKAAIDGELNRIGVAR